MKTSEAQASEIDYSKKYSEADRLAYNLGNENFDLNPRNLIKAAYALFDNGLVFSRDSYLKNVVIPSYEKFDLSEYERINLLTDLESLLYSFYSGERIVNGYVKQRTNNLFIMNGLSRRLAIPSIELAMKTGVKKIIFNSLLEDHIDIVKDRIEQCYKSDKDVKLDVFNIGEDTMNVKRGNFFVELKFLVGDFIEEGQRMLKETKERFDMILANDFTTSEIGDFSSSEAMREIETKFYSTVASLLIKQGVLIEEMPHVGEVGSYYNLLWHKTQIILKELGFLPGFEHKGLLSIFEELSDNSKKMFPYHLRRVFSHEDHEKSLNKTGLHSGGFMNPMTLPKNAKSLYQPLDNGIKYLFRDLAEKEIKSFLRTQQTQYLEYPEFSDPTRKVKKIVVSRNFGLEND